jgi:DNA invertase Pin-like site-specific DNA recombinase
MVQETIIGDLRKRGIELVSVAEPDLCSDDPSRKLVRQIFGAISEYEKCMIVLKLRGARQRMKARTGRCEGMKAFGEGRTERKAVSRILELRATGLAMDKIALTINAEGLKPKYGVQWYGSSVRNVLNRNMASQGAWCRRTTLYLYADDLDNVQALSAYAFNNGASRANVSLIVRAAVAVLASSPYKKFVEALVQVSKADQRFKGEK